MKLYEIVNAVTPLRKLVAQDLSLKTAYRVSKLVDKLNTHLTYFDQNRDRIAKLADNDSKELDELLDEDIDLDADKVQISLDEPVKLSAGDIGSLEKFIEFVDADVEGA
jgi:hypothetical protein